MNYKVISYFQKRNNASWENDIFDLLTRYLEGRPIYVGFTQDKKRNGSVGRLVITNLQDILHGNVAMYGSPKRRTIPEIPASLNRNTCCFINIHGYIVWDNEASGKKRSNKVVYSNYDYYGDVVWLDERGDDEGTHWEWNLKPPTVTKVAVDKLGEEIKVGDFISYILYHFDNAHNAAGLYYGKVTKVENDGEVWAKNIKLSNDDKVEDKKIKDNSLIVKMSNDIMDKLMIARMSSL